MINYVFYDDTDCGGIVYHSNYITFCERARSLVFFENGILPFTEFNNKTNRQDFVGFVVKSIQSNFIATLKLGDKYQVKTKVVDIKNTFVNLEQEIFKIGEVGSNEIYDILVFQMNIKLACIDIANKKARKIPDNLKNVCCFFDEE